MVPNPHDALVKVVFFLFDHLSAPPKKDNLLAFRLVCYQVRIWEDWHARHQDLYVRFRDEDLLLKRRIENLLARATPSSRDTSDEEAS